MAPPKKAPGTRQRRNRAPGSARLEAVDGDRLTPFELPEARTLDTADGNRIEVPWHPATVAWWADVWASPMRSEYLDADRHALLVLAVLVDSFWRNPSTALAAEIRLQRQCFGLTPLDRRRLEWEIDRAEQPRRARPVPASSEEGRPDPRGALRSVPTG